MAQNIYDDDGFFTNYSRLQRSVHGLDGAPEWDVLRGLLPPLPRLRIVDLGCGFGWFCRWAAAAGAASVLGIDISSRMLERARAGGDDARIEFRRADLAEIDLDAGAFDLAFSSLALHYLDDLDRLFGQIARAVVPSGHLIFSVEHPIVTAPSSPKFVDRTDGSTIWPMDSYLDEGRRVTDWLAPGVVKYHRTVQTHVNGLVRAGFELEALIEWGPSEDQIAEFPQWAAERHRPSFLLIRARRGTPLAVDL